MSPGETIPLEVSQFIAAQLGEKPDALACYAETDVTRRRHLADLRELYGYKMFSGRGARDLKAWLEEQAETAPSNRDLAQKFVEECRRTQTILPGVSVVERLCADALVETHDRIVGKTWRDAKKICDARVADAKSALHDTLRSFKTLGVALLEAKGDGASLDTATENACGWHHLEGLVATAAKLTDTMAADPLSPVVQGFHRFRRYPPRMLRALEIQAAPVAEPLLAAATIVEKGRSAELAPAHFLRRGSK